MPKPSARIFAVNSNWRALVGPRGLQAAQIAYWEDLAAKLSKSDAWKKELEGNFWEAHVLTGHALRDFLADEHKEHREVLGELGLAK